MPDQPLHNPLYDDLKDERLMDETEATGEQRCTCICRCHKEHRWEAVAGIAALVAGAITSVAGYAVLALLIWLLSDHCG